jgi:hypothetical protein
MTRVPKSLTVILVATRISDRFIDVDTEAGPLRLTREALMGAVGRLALDESCSTTVAVTGRLPSGARCSVQLDESDINSLLSSMREVTS